MTPEDRRELDQPTQPEADAEGARKAERLLHHKFEAWLRLNKLGYDHSRTDRKATNTAGKPDFEVYGRAGTTCHVEFKVPPNVLSDDQERFLFMLHTFGHHAIVTDSAVDAINWTKKQLGMV